MLWGLGDGGGWHFHGSTIAADVDASTPGLECYGRSTRGSKDGSFSVTAKGKNRSGSINQKVAYTQGNWLRQAVSASDADIIADIAGDWREEVISWSNGAIRVNSPSGTASNKRTSLLTNRFYRCEIVRQANGYGWDPPQMSTPVNPDQAYAKLSGTSLTWQPSAFEATSIRLQAAAMYDLTGRTLQQNGNRLTGLYLSNRLLDAADNSSARIIRLHD